MRILIGVFMMILLIIGFIPAKTQLQPANDGAGNRSMIFCAPWFYSEKTKKQSVVNDPFKKEWQWADIFITSSSIE